MGSELRFYSLSENDQSQSFEKIETHGGFDKRSD
jgi:hypothetical protein